MSENLYRINDVLTALMGELDAYHGDEDEIDAMLDDLTHTVAEAFQPFTSKVLVDNPTGRV